MATQVDARPKIAIETRLFIGGEFVDAIDSGRCEVINPHDNTVLCEISEAGTKDVDRAVAAARKAFPAWKRMPASERGRLLYKLADAIEADREYLTQLETLDTGHPIRDTTNLDLPRTAATFRYFAGMCDKIDGRVAPVEPGFLNYILREPLGVIGEIVPWNFPMMFVSWKLAPALAAGNVCVMKPAELTPLSALRIAKLSADVGFPPGVINIIPGAAAWRGSIWRNIRASTRLRSPVPLRSAARSFRHRPATSSACSSNSAAKAPISSLTTRLSTLP